MVCRACAEHRIYISARQTRRFFVFCNEIPKAEAEAEAETEAEAEAEAEARPPRVCLAAAAAAAAAAMHARKGGREGGR